MVKAYQKPGTKKETYRYCNDCGEWTSQDDDWIRHTVFIHPGYARWEFADEEDQYIFPEACTEGVSWECDQCNNYYMHSISEERAVWVCGNCKAEYSEQDQARRCCS